MVQLRVVDCGVFRKVSNIFVIREGWKTIIKNFKINQSCLFFNDFNETFYVT